MAEKNIQMQRKTATGYDTYYPKTKAGLVEFADGTTVEAHKADYAQPHLYEDEGEDPDWAGVKYRIVMIDGQMFMEVVES